MAAGIIELTHEPLDLVRLEASVHSDVLGGVVIFSGVVRSMTGSVATRALAYEAYEEMALGQMTALANEAEAIYGAKVSIAHRLGKLDPGEVAVICIAACAHRKEAFAACEFVIDKLKADVPIWKKDL